MPRESEGPRLWFKRGNVGADGRRKPGTWTIKDDGGVRVSTGIRAARGGKPPEAAHAALARYILEKRKTPREKRRGADAIQVADVIAIYMQDRVPSQAMPRDVVNRCKKLLSFWGDKKLSEVSGKTCRDYATFRGKPVARRELEDLKAAINYHRDEGYCREVVEVVLPKAGQPRDRWLTRDEAARLIWTAWTFREKHNTDGPGRRSRQHIARFVLVALYTGTRSHAVCSAAFEPGHGAGWFDLKHGVFYRRAPNEAETKKRRPPAKLPGRLIAHLRRWRKNGQTFAVEWCGKRINTVEKGFERTCRDAGLKDVTPHTLRHTAATWLMQNGTDMWQAAGYLGMTVQTLQQVYGHHHPNHLQQAVENIVRKPNSLTSKSDVPVHVSGHDQTGR